MGKVIYITMLPAEHIKHYPGGQRDYGYYQPVYLSGHEDVPRLFQTNAMMLIIISCYRVWIIGLLVSNMRHMRFYLTIMMALCKPIDSAEI